MSQHEVPIQAFETWMERLDEQERGQLRVLWGKSKEVLEPVPLLQHLLDTLCVGDLMWEHYLAPKVTDRLDQLTDGRGRAFFRWLGGAHDLGKCSPAFVSQEKTLVEHIEHQGLPIDSLSRKDAQVWRHDLAGAAFLRKVLVDRWPAEQVDWIWPIIGGHHGLFYSAGQTGARKQRRDLLHRRRNGGPAWDTARWNLLEGVTIAAGYDAVEAVAPIGKPRRGEQLALTGLVMMADWIASGSHFSEAVEEPSLGRAAHRAERAWQALGLRGGWGRLAGPPADLFAARFPFAPKASQELVLDVARTVPAPPLLLIEAPMGEGKTEAALAAAELLAHRFGCDGVLVGLPTQATADPMLGRVATWLDTVDASAEISLVHGRSAFNERWEALRARRTHTPASAASEERDEYGQSTDYYDICTDADPGDHDEDDVLSGHAAAEWFLGRHRPLLAANVVTTIDQPLFAGTRTRSAAIRFAGLAGKVVILDEVHAADDYMSVFLTELLRWLAEAGVPVVLLSATLAASQREQLIEAYRAGALGEPDRPVAEVEPLPGYPAVTAVWGGPDAGRSVVTSRPHRPDTDVAVEVVTAPLDEADGGLSERIEAMLDADGGCVLVIRNTVDRAQRFAEAARERFGADVVLLHSRFTARDRAEITDRLVTELGPGGDQRPRRRIVVATQVAEQSFDVDADLLVSDLAPVDLLLQRMGRLHRHERDARPASLARPRVLVTGVESIGDRPVFAPGSERIYGRHRLLRSLAALAEGDVVIPSGIAPLTERAYGSEPGLPSAWVEDEATARAAWEAERATEVAQAQQGTLGKEGASTQPTLADLSGGVTSIRDVESFVKVRSGDSGEEVLLVTQVDGRYRTLAGVDLGINGEGIHELRDVRAVIGDSLQLPAFDHELNAAARKLPTLPEWHDHPWLRRRQVLVLDEHGNGRLGERSIRYAPGVGLIVGSRR